MEKSRCRLLFVLFALAFMAACVHAQTGRFTESSFAGGEGRFGFSYLDRSGGSLLPGAWRLENWTLDSTGRPESQKDQGVYLSEAQWPLPDGSLRWMQFVTHELRYDHAASGATIWVRVLPMMQREAGLSLKVVAERWANTVSGTVFDYTFYGAEGAKRLGSKILATGGVTVGGRPAHQVVFDVVNVDQFEVDPNAPRTRVQAYFVAASVTKDLFSSKGGWQVPACVFIGLAAPAERFDAVMPDFTSLVSRMWVATPAVVSRTAEPGVSTRSAFRIGWTRRD
jgi:hypothetical protein